MVKDNVSSTEAITKGVHIFPKCMSLSMKVVGRVIFELIGKIAIVQHVIHNTT